MLAALMRSCSHVARAGAKQGGTGRSCCNRLAEPKGSSVLWRRRDEKPAIDLRRLRCAGPCACGGALVVLMVLPLRFILASQAGLVIGWRAGAMPSNILAALGAKAGMGDEAPAGGGASATSDISDADLDIQIDFFERLDM